MDRPPETMRARQVREEDEKWNKTIKKNKLKDLIIPVHDLLKRIDQSEDLMHRAIRNHQEMKGLINKLVDSIVKRNL